MLSLSSNWHQKLCDLHGLKYSVCGDEISAIERWFDRSPLGSVAVFADPYSLWLEPTFNLCEALPLTDNLAAVRTRSGEFDPRVFWIRNTVANWSFIAELRRVFEMRSDLAFQQGLGMGQREQFNSVIERMKVSITVLSPRFNSTSESKSPLEATILKRFYTASDVCAYRRMTKAIERLENGRS